LQKLFKKKRTAMHIMISGFGIFIFLPPDDERRKGFLNLI